MERYDWDVSIESGLGVAGSGVHVRFRAFGPDLPQSVEGDYRPDGFQEGKGLDTTTHNFRGSGRPPETDEYLAMMANGYEDDYVLEIRGYVERPMTLTMQDLRDLAGGHSQTALHQSTCRLPTPVR